ncbi:hypothetical protein RLEG12_08330 (plasmid) [Rhizobium leguminosarum bv. trifolii CB782]|nr:hypothetical protein RLEG12_08330 [Rhizobium leguminosarum bv. trifolii CB782]
MIGFARAMLGERWNTEEVEEPELPGERRSMGRGGAYYRSSYGKPQRYAWL